MGMTVAELIYITNGIVEDSTTIVIRKNGRSLACGNWYEDKMGPFLDYEIEEFTWKRSTDSIKVEIGRLADG